MVPSSALGLYDEERTHFSGTGVKTTAPLEVIEKILDR